MQTRKILTAVLLLLMKLLFAIVVILAIWRLGESAYRFGHSIYDNESMAAPPGWDVAVVLPEGCTVKDTASLLKAKGLIRDAFVFRIQERLSKYHGEIQAGSYVLNTSMSAQDILALLSGHAEDITEKEDDE